MKSLKFFILTSLILVLVSLSLVSAAEKDVSADDLILSYGSNYDIQRDCFNNNTYCSNTAQCNLTIKSIEGQILINNQPMQNQVSFHNLSTTNTVLKDLERFPTTMICSDNSLSGFDTFDIIITADGKDPSNFPITLVFLFIGFGILGIGLINEKLRLFKTLGSFVIMAMGVLTLWPGYSIINYTTLAGKAVGFTAIGLGTYFVIEDVFSRDKQVEGYNQNDDGRYHD